MVRVTFAGEELAAFGWNGPASHIKLIFDDSGEHASTQGAAIEQGTPPQPASQQASQPVRATMRTYTPRKFNPDAQELEVDFVIHGEGPASAWAEQAAVGQSLTIAGPGRSYSVDPGAEWYLLAGDDSAIPAIGTILETLPASMKVLVLIEIVDAAEEHSLAAGVGHSLDGRGAHSLDARGVERPRAEVRWLPRGPDPRNAGRELEAAVRRVELPPGPGRVYVACEAEAMRRIRRHLLQERQFPRAHLVTRGYWRYGETDHPDRDYGEDVT
jgi:NADPH-dependent ferric siderophore reductase